MVKIQSSNSYTTTARIRLRRMMAGEMVIYFPFVIVCCCCILFFSAADASTDANDVSALNVLYSSLNSPGQLTGWTSNSGDPCGQSWKGITCSDSSVTAIKLSGLGLNGNLGYQMASLTSLTELDLSNNNLGGGNQIPYNLPPNLQKINLAGNSFNGMIPYSISQMVTLEELNLGRNQFQGNLTDSFDKLTNLTTLDLSSNSLSGNLPESLSSLSSLSTLYLQNNQFTGSIDVLANLPLQDLNVANNHFTGWIPDQLKKINNLQLVFAIENEAILFTFWHEVELLLLNGRTDGNSWSAGPAPPPPPFTPPPSGRRINPGPRSGSGGGGNSSGDKGGGSSGINGGGIAGIIISILVVGAIIAFFLMKKKTRKLPHHENLDHDQPFAPLAFNEVKEMNSVQKTTAAETKTELPSAPLSLKPPPVERLKSFDDNDITNKPVEKPAVQKRSTPPIKATVYSIADLQMATDSFSVDNLIGEGSLGRVYRAHFDDGKVLAVKKINSSALPNQSPEDFLEVVSNISRLHHPNLTELVGYCFEHGQYLLVYEFQKNGSLHDLLHLSDEYSKPLSWNSRVKIALGSARALEYLHEVCSPSVVHKIFKSDNILLDMELNPHVSDSGLANLIPNPEYQGADHNMGSGYSAPEVAMSGQYTLKSDVYSFGVVMLELLTGRKPFDSSRPRYEQLLVRWATPQLHDIDALDKMVDPALQGLYPAKSLSRFADVIALCVQSEPEFRPPMSEVVQALVRLVQRANMSKRMMGGGDIQEDYPMM